MTFLINFSGSRFSLTVCLLFLVFSGCAIAPYKVSPQDAGVTPVGMKSLIAVMPVENLTGMPVSVEAVSRSLVQSMKQKDLNILGDDVLEKFLERHRIRYTGGLNRDLGKALWEEMGVNAVLFASLELFDKSNPPKAALSARLVSTHGNSDLQWMEGIGIAGNDAPGFLLLGLIDDPSVIWEKAKGRVLDSLTAYLSGKLPRDARRAEKRFGPKSFHGVASKFPGGMETVSVAVLPFRNESTRRNAGEILALHFTRELTKTGKFDVAEPGEVRQVLLRSRTIMEGGLSLPQADVLHAALDVDLVVTGIVTEYQDSIGEGGKPKVEFSARVFDMKTRQIVWSSFSYNQGDDGVFFFNLGKVNTAHGIASGMVRSVVEKIHATMDAGTGKSAKPVQAGLRR